MKKNLLSMLLLVVLVACMNDHSGSVTKSLHKDLSYSEAIKQDYVVNGPSGLANADLFETFIKDYEDQKQGSITLVRYTDEGDPIYVDLEFTGHEVLFAYDNTWDSFAGNNKGVRETSCAQLEKRSVTHNERRGTEYYLNTCKKDIGYSNPEKQEYYLLFVPEDEH